MGTDDGSAVLVEEFRGFLGGERGLASETLRCYGNHARAFLTSLQPVDVAWLGWPRAVTGFMVEYSGPQHRVGQGDGDRVAVAAAVPARDRADAGLAGGRGPGGGDWRLAALPRGLPAPRSRCCWTAATGHRRRARDFAIMMLLARLGLRVARVAALQLEDVDWRAGELLFGARAPADRLPLPADVGEALAGYLRAAGRPAGSPGGVPDRAGRRPGADRRRRSRRRARRAARGPGSARARAPAAARPGRRAAAPGRRAGRDRPGASPPQSGPTALYAKVDLTTLRGRWPSPGRGAR